jgi:hypothetical protein
MANLTTGEAISSYKQLMHDPATAEIWQTAFGKDFSSMAQGDLKTEKEQTQFLSWRTQKSQTFLKIKPLLTPASLWTTVPKNQIPTEFGSQQAEI